MRITKKRHLEIAIENIPRFESPKIDLEQYPTSASIAADLLWNAKNLGDISNRSLIDLGCGTGVFAISSALLNARCAMGVDIDSSAIKIAKKTVNNMKISNVNFITEDINNLENFDLENDSNLNNNSNNLNNNFNNYDYLKNLKFETAITNPPFGAQSRGKRGADRIFMKIALNLAKVVYSFHIAETKDFVTNFYENLGGNITHEFFYKFPLLNTYEFHTQESRDIEVIVFRVCKYI